ncbi:uncharacterized protein BT62DRAFT_149766 [Guyanagaster necrorhizus]|uniref:Protein BIG1 n=1 Tax=Guyanagaster necrorhizus TaxID=856835 RepID=A0A9P7VTZ6_9AGAR|nr:uncharacterized protein BT62DRAFT_149766 [Guyanagaster necrorhizus MCA 3950]KAG7446039.1 hypothetical protein BT62DRAFT_149766 [Guyanagaster necrorhizus MCA 3950]
MTRLAFLLSLLPAALAFSDTFPTVAWSSHSSNVLSRLPSRTHSTDLFRTILLDDDLCVHEAVIVVDQPGLHASDLRNLPSTSHIARSLNSSTSSRQYPYIRLDDYSSSGDLISFAQSVSAKCNARLIGLTPGYGDVALDAGKKSVVIVSLPELSVEGYARKSSMLQHGTSSRLHMHVSALTTLCPDELLELTLSALPYSQHLTIYSTSVLPTHHKRQSPDSPPVLDLPPTNLLASPKGGILARYQLLTPGLILALLIVVGVLLPIIYFGIQALASIQSPVRMDTPKGFNAADKKNQ